MKLTVRVHPNSKVEKIEKISEFSYEVYFNVIPEAGRANRKLVEMLASYFEVAKSRVIIRAGDRARTKIVEIVE